MKEREKIGSNASLKAKKRANVTIAIEDQCLRNNNEDAWKKQSYLILTLKKRFLTLLGGQYKNDGENRNPKFYSLATTIAKQTLATRLFLKILTRFNLIKNVQSRDVPHLITANHN